MAHPPPAPVVGPHPITATLLAFPAVCFTLALLTDLAYWRTVNLMWQNFSAWLLFAGLVFGGVAALAWLVEAIARRRPNTVAGAFLYLVVLGLAFLNSLVHAGDGWTAVVPYGLALSAATVVLMIVTAMLGRRPATTAGATVYA